MLREEFCVPQLFGTDLIIRVLTRASQGFMGR
jgi:hypothetical protein